MTKLKSVRIILLVRQEGWGIKALKKLGLVRVIDYGGSKLSVLDLRVPSLH
jgi:hypothetical protein